ncbi:RNA-binding S4 domain-containing protein [Novosphingobium sp.]|jgi:ribosome-associated heat shock protein Hsp15|uniref:RNA-binding S4 domain-containing protein n=1 Tax=Novosphingobium sp. TaxID=1874826 RepID=UPI002FDEBD2C
MRIDKLLWFLRFAGSRGLAQGWVEEGHIRVNGRRIERCSAAVKVGDIMVLPTHGGVRVIEIVALPARRGPAPEAQGCYRVLDAAPLAPLARREIEP